MGVSLSSKAIEKILNIIKEESSGQQQIELPGIATNTEKGFMSPDMVIKLLGIESGANKYTHPTSAGNKHIPAGGSAGQILRWAADGTATWGNDNNTTYGTVSKSAAGLAPQLPNETATTKYLRQDGTWAVPPDTNTTYTAASASPKMDGTAAVGASAKYAREDHVHPVDTSRAAASHTHSYLPLTGGTVSGATIFSLGTRVIDLSNGSGTTGYMYVCQLKITGTYQNQPIEFRVIQRGRSGEVKVAFTSVNGHDPALSYFKKTGTVEAYIVKSATSTWDLYIQKTEAYDNIAITELHKGSYMNSTTITWKNNTVTSLPSGYVTASAEGYNGSATKLATARALKIGNTSKNFDGTAGLTWTVAEIGAAAASHSHNAATQSAAGYMSAADKKRLDNITFATSKPSSLADGAICFVYE